MKRVLALIALLFVTGSLHAVTLDRYGSSRPAVWRSTRTCVAQGFGLLVSSPVIIHAVTIDSATVSNAGGSYVAIFNSTAIPISNNSANFISSAAFVGANVTANGGAGWVMNYDLALSSGAVVVKQGASCTSILWDFIFRGANWPDIQNDAVYPWLP